MNIFGVKAEIIVVDPRNGSATRITDEDMKSNISTRRSRETERDLLSNLINSASIGNV